MSGPGKKASWRRGVAWLLLSLAFAVHVADEALNDFLAVYNPIAADVRERWSLLALPTFTFGVWITQLFLALTALFMLTPLAFQGRRWMRPLSYAYAIVMLGNGFMHVIGSIYFGRVLPGSYSSPLLIVAALFLLIVVAGGRSRPAVAS